MCVCVWCCCCCCVHSVTDLEKFPVQVSKDEAPFFCVCVVVGGGLFFLGGGGGIVIYKENQHPPFCSSRAATFSFWKLVIRLHVLQLFLGNQRSQGFILMPFFFLGGGGEDNYMFLFTELSMAWNHYCLEQVSKDHHGHLPVVHACVWGEGKGGSTMLTAITPCWFDTIWATTTSERERERDEEKQTGKFTSTFTQSAL